MNPGAKGTMAKKKILLVDDSDTSLMMGLLVLKKGSYDVIVARDGEEGVEKAVAERPDLILMDVVMPRLDGFSALQQLRSRDQTRGIPVIMLTTRSESDALGSSLQGGAMDYLTKPLDAQELLTKVRGHIGT